MDFSYQDYLKLLDLLRSNNFEFVNYHNYINKERCVILRHDVDNDISKALEFAKIEKECGVASTYFILVSSNFYNVNSVENASMIQEIVGLGHEIGLHFDEMRYPKIYGDVDKIKSMIYKECDLLSDIIGIPIQSVSMHRPSKEILDANIELDKIVNSYGKKFFHEFKYLSDSRRNWREPVEDIIRSGKCDRLHILTHPFWYSDTVRQMKEVLLSFCLGKSVECYDNLKNNFRDLSDVITRSEVEYTNK